MTYNIDVVEDLVAYNCLTNRLYLSTVIDILEPSCFDKSYNKTVVTLILKFYNQHKVFHKNEDLVLLISDENTKKLFKDALKQYKNLPKEINHLIFIQYSELFFKEILLYNAVNKTVGEFKSKDNVDFNDILKRFTSACNVSLINNVGMDYFEQIDSHIDNLSVVDETFSTGYKYLDKKLGGGFAKNGKALYVGLGVPNVGKSIVLGNIAANVLAQGKVVSIISLEMSEHVYAKRMTALFSGIGFSKMKDNTGELKNRLNDYKDSIGRGKLIIKEYAPKEITVENLVSYYDMLAKKDVKPDFVVRDYVDLIRWSNSRLNREEGSSEVAEKIRALTYYLKCPILSMTQSNREGLKQESDLGMENSANSMGIPRTTDFLFTLDQEEEDKQLGVIRAGIVKSRFGEAFGKWNWRVDYNTLKLTEEGDYFSESADEVENKLNSL